MTYLACLVLNYAAEWNFAGYPYSAHSVYFYKLLGWTNICISMPVGMYKLFFDWVIGKDAD